MQKKDERASLTNINLDGFAESATHTRLQGSTARTFKEVRLSKGHQDRLEPLWASFSAPEIPMALVACWPECILGRPRRGSLNLKLRGGSLNLKLPSEAADLHHPLKERRTNFKGNSNLEL